VLVLPPNRLRRRASVADRRAQLLTATMNRLAQIGALIRWMTCRLPGEHRAVKKPANRWPPP
jgi:hypothetical protein